MRYLVWSNRNGGWWRQQRNGFTRSLDEAGSFEHDEARDIVALATWGEGGRIERSDPFTGRVYWQYSDVMIAAPLLVAS